MGRWLDLRPACLALEQLLDAGVEPRREVLLSFGPLALLTGRLAAAEHTLTEALARHDLASWQRVRAQVALGLLRTHQGRGDDGRAVLRGAVAESPSREVEGVLLAAEVYSYWLDERDAEATESLRRATALLQSSSPAVHGVAFAPAALALALGRLGRFAEADVWLRLLAERLARSGDARAHLIYKTVLAYMDYERGARVQALAALTQAGDEIESVGAPLHSLRARICAARLLLTIGRRRQGHAALDEIAAKAHQLGFLGLVQMVERSRLLDPIVELRALHATHEPSTRIGAVVRARRMNALRAACNGDGETVAALLEVDAPLPAGVDYALDRALGHLARSVVARAQGNSDTASTALAAARREAQSGDVDLDLLDELAAEFGQLRVMAGSRTRLCASYTNIASSDAIVLDARSHELRVGDQVYALKRQAMLREILYVLSAKQGYAVSKQDVARHLWSRYDPTVHDNRLWANIHRLRLFLAPTGLNIEFADDGYRLISPRDFVFVALCIRPPEDAQSALTTSL
jgi:tetratricopeptide (TPR) repeat protein